jgi:hypothetical protein
LLGPRPVQPECAPLRRELLAGRRRTQHELDRIAGCRVQENKGERDDAEHDSETGE